MNIRDMMPKNDAEQALALVREKCEAGALEPWQTQRIGKGGRAVQVSLVVSALVNDAGETYAIASTERRVDEKLRAGTPVA